VLLSGSVSVQETLMKTSFTGSGIARATALAAGRLAVGVAAQETGGLNVHHWADCTAPAPLSSFKKETGIKVRHVVFDGNESPRANPDQATRRIVTRTFTNFKSNR
jgi:spermidine/putrescine-binding protein